MTLAELEIDADSSVRTSYDHCRHLPSKVRVTRSGCDSGTPLKSQGLPSGGTRAHTTMSLNCEIFLRARLYILPNEDLHNSLASPSLHRERWPGVKPLENNYDEIH